MSRRSYKQRLSDIFRRLDVADGLVRLQVLVTEYMIREEEVPQDNVVPRVSRSCKSVIHEEPSYAEASAAILSTDTLMRAFPPDRLQRCGAVFERRCGGRSGKKPVDDQEVMAAPVDEGNTDELIVDPHPLECYGEVLRTPAEVVTYLS
ncbi:hypothetical protein Hanom_Chr00s000003g01604051 [Helianthus anomalus]